MPSRKRRPFWKKRGGAIRTVVHDPDVFDYLTADGGTRMATVQCQAGRWSFHAPNFGVGNFRPVYPNTIDEAKRLAMDTVRPMMRVRARGSFNG